LRGFTFAYPSERADDLDRIALAVANAFDPFADTPASHGAAAMRAKSARSPLDVVRVAASAPAPAPGGLPVTGLSPGARPTPTPLAPSPTPSATAAPAELTATALYVAPGQALTALPAGQCAELSVDRKPAKLLRADQANGLALLGGDFAPAATAPMLASGASDLVVLSLSPAAGGKSTLEASPGAVAPLADGSRAVVAALTQSASGAPALDRSGALAGVIAPIATPPRRIGAVTLAEPHGLIGAEAVAAFLGLAAPAPAASEATLDAGEIALRLRGALAQVVCKP
jgi:hypothetical protein